MTETGVCRTCGAPVLWLRHERTQKIAPIERDPSPLGNVVVDCSAGTYRLVTVHHDPQTNYRLNHYARCRDASFWRRQSAAQVRTE